MSAHLQIRLKNCLQTIVDLEPDMEGFSLFETFKDEITTLKGYLKEVDNLSMSENDVLRLEEATAVFLQELYLPYAHMESLHKKRRVLQ